jgi:hypothetical protein
MHFNKKLISLRNKKVTLVNDINKSIDRIEQIQFMLGEQTVDDFLIERPQLRLEEIPEK